MLLAAGGGGKGGGGGTIGLRLRQPLNSMNNARASWVTIPALLGPGGLDTGGVHVHVLKTMALLSRKSMVYLLRTLAACLGLSLRVSGSRCVPRTLAECLGLSLRVSASRCVSRALAA